MQNPRDMNPDHQHADVKHSSLHFFSPLSDVLFSFPSPFPGDAAPNGGWPGPASLQQPERHAGEGGGDLDLFPVQSANRPRGGSPAGRTEDQILRYTFAAHSYGCYNVKTAGRHYNYVMPLMC